MPDSATDTIYDEELDLSPEVLSLLLRRRTAVASISSSAGGVETADDRHRRIPTRGHGTWF